jgi:hypothetical protein
VNDAKLREAGIPETAGRRAPGSAVVVAQPLREVAGQSERGDGPTDVRSDPSADATADEVGSELYLG